MHWVIENGVKWGSYYGSEMKLVSGVSVVVESMCTCVCVLWKFFLAFRLGRYQDGIGIISPYKLSICFKKNKTTKPQWKFKSQAAMS